MYKTTPQPTCVLKHDDDGFSIETTDGFVLWHGLSADATKNLATKSLFCELSFVEKQLEELLSARQLREVC